MIHDCNKIHDSNMIYDCIIIGGGAAGLFCAAGFPPQPEHGGFRGLILEKTHRPGTKLLMSGGGQCNITHSGSIKDFIPRYGKNGGKVRSCLYRYNNLHLQAFLQENGVKTVTREDGKVFPQSMDARQIRDMLLSRAGQNGFRLRTDAQVTGVARRPDGLWQVTCDQRVSVGRCLIVASGGCSYPATGSDGGFFNVLRRDLELAVTQLRPALTPVNVCGYPYRALAGIGLQNVQLTVWRQEKKAAEAVGSLLFTHENFSGPLILNISKNIVNNDRIMLNYIYPCDKILALDKIVHGMKTSRLQPQNLLPELFGLPKSLIQAILAQTGEKPKAIAARLTEDSFTVESLAGFSKAMVTSGGVALSEIDPKTMESRRYPGLFVIGEALDIDGETGGYNLQFAYASARTAGQAIVHSQKSV